MLLHALHHYNGITCLQGFVTVITTAAAILRCCDGKTSNSSVNSSHLIALICSALEHRPHGRGQAVRCSEPLRLKRDTKVTPCQLPYGPVAWRPSHGNPYCWIFPCAKTLTVATLPDVWQSTAFSNDNFGSSFPFNEVRACQHLDEVQTTCTDTAAAPWQAGLSYNCAPGMPVDQSARPCI